LIIAVNKNIMGKFIISMRSKEIFQFTFLDNEGKILLYSQGYTRKPACQNGANAIKRNCIHPLMYKRISFSPAHHYFTIKSSNGQIIGTSDFYETEEIRDEVILAVMEQAPGASIIELLEQLN
jgi:uncharacterized protein